MSQSNNPRYWASPWYRTKFAKEPWPEGWYWHDQHYDWHGPYASEIEARAELKEHERTQREAIDRAARSA